MTKFKSIKIRAKAKESVNHPSSCHTHRAQYCEDIGLVVLASLTPLWNLKIKPTWGIQQRSGKRLCPNDLLWDFRIKQHLKLKFSLDFLTYLVYILQILKNMFHVLEKYPFAWVNLMLKWETCHKIISFLSLFLAL